MPMPVQENQQIIKQIIISLVRTFSIMAMHRIRQNYNFESK